MGCRKGARKPGARRKKKTVSQDGRGATLLQQAYSLHQQGDFPAAQQAYETFVARFPRHGEALGNFGLLLHSQGQAEQAVRLYQQAVALSPSLAHLYYFLGNGLRELGRPQEAIDAYKKALAANHNQAETLLHLGLAHLDAGQLEAAEECFAAVLRVNPEDSQASYQLGLLFFQQEQFAKAVACFAAVFSRQPDHVDACFNLALCHKALGHSDQALDYLAQAAELNSLDAEILYNIGVLHREQGDTAKAEATFLQALEIDPANGICLTDLAILYHVDNRLAEAKAMYQRAMATGYQLDSAQHMLAALSGQTTVAAPLAHIRDLFNNYASAFDQSLVAELEYSVPGQLARLFGELQGEGAVVSAAVDLGCGTGLSGLAFRDQVRHLCGVDLSENMLARAAAKQLYDELHCASIIDYLQSCAERYDLALATDVFVYLGDLEPFFQHLSPRLKPGGYLLFSVESCDHDYCLRQSGRYAHGSGYLDHLAERFGFRLRRRQQTGIRKERGEWIAGELYILQRS